MEFTRSWSQKNRFTLTIPLDYREELCGMCGNYNGDKNDDYCARGSTERAKSYKEIGDSYFIDLESDQE